MATRICNMVTEHDRAEFARMAQSAYQTGRMDVWHVFGNLSQRSLTSLRESLRPSEFDRAMEMYRDWLVFGNFPAGAL